MSAVADLDRLLGEIPRTLDEVIERERAAGLLLGPAERARLIAKAPDRVQRELRLAARRRGPFAADSTFLAKANRGFPDGNLRAAINTTTTETNLWDPAIHAPIPVGEAIAGRSWVVEFGGVMGTTATPAISFRGRFGTNNSAPPTGTDLGVGPTVTLGTFTAQPFYGRFVCGIRTLGVAASTTAVKGSGFVAMPAAAAATVTPHAVLGGLSPTTIDTAVAQGISVSVIWGTSNAANTLTPEWMTFVSV